MGWESHNKYYLTGSITSGLTLSPTNADSGTVPTDMSISTYNDYTYDDSTYERTAIFEGKYNSDFKISQITWTSVGDASDIKYQVQESDNDIDWTEWSGEADAIATTTVISEKQYFKIRFLFYSSVWTDSDSVVLSSIVRAFSVFTKREIVRANKFNENFYVIGRDDLLPRGGAYLNATTGVYNLGSLGYKWKDTYVDHLADSDEIGGTLNLIEGVILSVAAQKIEFTGLEDSLYYISCKFVQDTISSDDTLLFFNADSATNYGYQLLFNTTGSRSVATSGIYIGECGSSTSYIGGFDGWINTNETREKMVIGSGFNGVATTGVERFFVSGGIWSNESDAVTSITIFNNSKFAANTEIRLWARK